MNEAPAASGSILRPGLVFALSGPAGSGKTALVEGLRALEPSMYFCVTATTRAPRPGEIDGVDYFFLSEADFLDRVAREEFLEHARVPPLVGNFYGSPSQPVLDAVDAGRDVFLQVDVQGARSIRLRLPTVTTIFLRPPDVGMLQHRLRKRGTESTADVERRLANALVEMDCEPEFDYCVVNADGGLDEAIAEVQAIIALKRQAAGRGDPVEPAPHG